MKRERQVFFNSDAGGITLLSVALYSLLKTARTDRPLVAYIACGLGFREAGCDRRLLSLAAKFPFARLVFLDFDPLVRKHAALFDSSHNRWSPLLWAFPLCTEILPHDVHGNIVYLDIDELVCHDLEALYSLPLREDGFVAAAVNETRRENLPHLLASGWPEEAGYGFSNATMVVDVDAYRTERIPEKILAWYAVNRDTAIAVDQDSQNAVFGTRTRRLPLKWNYSDGWLERTLKFRPWQREWRVHPREEVVEAILNPCILHFVGTRKPTGFTHRPERKTYHRLLREIGLYHDCFPHPPTFRQRAVEAFFDCYHAVLRRYVRLLSRLFPRSRTAEGEPAA